MAYQSISEQRHRYLHRSYRGNRSEEWIDPIESYVLDVNGWARTSKPRMREHCEGLLDAVANPSLLAIAIQDIGRHEILGAHPGLADPTWIPWYWLRDIQGRVLRGEFRRGKYEKYRIPKIGKNGLRTIEVPDEESRILSRNLCTLLTPILDPDFYSLSFGFRPQRGVAHCLAVAEELHQRGLRYLVCCDIRDAFGTIPKKRLLQVLRSRLHQSSVVGLMEELLDRKRSRGIPQGLSLSPLCLNVYLDHFLDRWWLRECPDAKLVRYADDIVVFCASRDAAEAYYDRLAKRVKTIGMTIKESCHEAVCDLVGGEATSWLGFTLREKSEQLKFSVSELSWCKLEAAFQEAKAKRHRGKIFDECHGTLMGKQWLFTKAPGIESAQIGVVAEQVRSLALSYGFSAEYLTDDLAAEVWSNALKSMQRFRSEIVSGLPTSCVSPA